MKSAIISTFDIRGGAAIATYRLHKALKKNGVNSCMFVASKDTADSTIFGRRSWLGEGVTKLITTLDNLPLWFYHNRQGIFSTAWIPDRLKARFRSFQPDVIHLFWVAGGMLRIESLVKWDKPIIWTLHDMWPFTGGCHYDNGCGKYTDSCGACPVLNSEKKDDLSRWVHRRKHLAWAKKNITVVSTSKWLAECAKSSSLFGQFRIEVIPNCVDTQKYQPLEKIHSRKMFGLNPHAKIVLFSGKDAHKDKRKGLVHLFDALILLGEGNFGADTIQLVLLGIGEDAILPDCPFPSVRIEHLHDEYSQVALYSAADVLVIPSLQENLANTAVEAISCGTPVVAFDIGGMPDIINYGETGYLARAFSAQSLAEGISNILNKTPNEAVELSKKCRNSAISRYSEQAVAGQYARLYTDVINQKKPYAH
jgi:glycosyltransferase involved in cell wall biosynthesis